MDHMHYSAKGRVGPGCLTHAPLVINPSSFSLITNLMLATLPPQKEEKKGGRKGGMR